MVSTVVAIDVVPFAMFAFTIFPVAPDESVIVSGWGLAPVASGKKSIALWLIKLSPASDELESVPLRATTPDAASIFWSSFAPASVESESVPSRIIVLLLPNSSFNISLPSSVPVLSVASKIIVLALSSTELLVIILTPAWDNWAGVYFDTSVRILSNCWPGAPMDSEVSITKTSPVPSSFAIPSPTFVPSTAPASNCIGGKYVVSGDS